jgi:hypothetical protein
MNARPRGLLAACLSGGVAAAREGVEDHEEPHDDEGHDHEQPFHRGRHNTGHLRRCS